LTRSKVARLITSPSQAGWFNMAADDLLAKTFNSQYAVIIRTYQWHPSAVSLGYHQTIGDVDPIACYDRGWDIVRRPTGGRTLLHDGDLCYSIIVPIENNHYAQLRSLYRKIAQALVSVFHNLGVQGTFSENKHKPNNSSLSKTRLCLESNVRGEVLIDGKKIAGASQRIYNDTILQHGSILINGIPEAIAQVIPYSDDKRNRVAKFLQRDACSLNTILDDPISCESFEKLLLDSLVNQFGVLTTAIPFSAEEIELIGESQSKFDFNHYKVNRIQ
jgi:lipoyl(octanoyl) transferase